jgi:hypothetical protein
VEHSRSTVLSFQKVETKIQNLSQLVTDTMQLMEEHLRTQSQELKSVQEETKMAIQSQIDGVKQRLQDLQTLNISIAEENKAGHLKLEALIHNAFSSLSEVHEIETVGLIKAGLSPMEIYLNSELGHERFALGLWGPRRAEGALI